MGRGSDQAEMHIFSKRIQNIIFFVLYLLGAKLEYSIDKRKGSDTILVNARLFAKIVGHFLCRTQPYCSLCYPNLFCSCTKIEFKIWIMGDGPQVLTLFKRRGIGTTMYRLAENHFCLRIMPDGKSSIAGQEFRKRYEQKFGSWKQKYSRCSDDVSLPKPVLVGDLTNGFIR